MCVGSGGGCCFYMKADVTRFLYNNLLVDLLGCSFINGLLTGGLSNLQQVLSAMPSSSV